MKPSIRLKNTVLVLAMALCGGLTTNVQAGTDACAVMLCMYGKLTGHSGGAECKPAEKKFFSIEVKKRGTFKPSPTFEARKAFLGECKGADPVYSDKILDQFGKARG